MPLPTRIGYEDVPYDRFQPDRSGPGESGSVPLLLLGIDKIPPANPGHSIRAYAAQIQFRLFSASPPISTLAENTLLFLFETDNPGEQL